MRFQNANIVHMGDLMFYLRNPRVDRPAGASIKNWIVTLEVGREGQPGRHDLHRRALESESPGHRDARRAAEVPRLLLRPARLRAERASRRADRRPEIVKVASVPGFADYEGSPEGTLQAAYEELTAKG